MKIDTEKLKNFLLDKSVSAYSIAKGSGVDRATLRRIRKGERKFEGLSLETIMRFQTYMNTAEKEKRKKEKENDSKTK